MRSDSTALTIANSSLNKEPRYIVVIYFSDTDLLYITSHDDIALPVSAISLDGALIDWNATSQHLNPEKANAAIGDFIFCVVDKDLSFIDILNTKHLAGKNLVGK